MAIFSHVQYRPWSTMPSMTMDTTMTVMMGGIPKIPRAAVIPMNSVTRVSQSVRIRSERENHPQKGPKESKMASACPRLVTAPSRTVISWTTYAMGPRMTRNQRRP